MRDNLAQQQKTDFAFMINPEVSFAIQENRDKFNRHISNITKLQEKIAAEESALRNCLALEKQLLAGLRI